MDQAVVCHSVSITHELLQRTLRHVHVARVQIDLRDELQPRHNCKYDKMCKHSVLGPYDPCMLVYAYYISCAVVSHCILEGFLTTPYCRLILLQYITSMSYD